MAERAESVIPAEAGIDRAPGLLDGAMSLDTMEFFATPWSIAMQDSCLAAMGLS